ncbi:MAG: M20/M25/M40 family metallo-hydrolase [Kineosporiaceae bacterium]
MNAVPSPPSDRPAGPAGRIPAPAPSSPVPEDRVEELRARLAEVLPGTRADLEALVRIPGIAAPAFDPAPLDAGAAAVAELLRGSGVGDVEVLRATVDGRPGAPAVVGRIPAPAGAPTVLLYAHHDVQPPGEESTWTSPAFEPVERDGRLFGRGAADDKAGIAVHLAALRVLAGRLGVGVTVFVEGEEEIGSPTFGAFLAAYRDRLAADVIVVADSANYHLGPCGAFGDVRWGRARRDDRSSHPVRRVVGRGR